MRFVRSRGFAAVAIIAVFGGTYIASSGATGFLFHSAAPSSHTEEHRTVSVAPSGGTGADSMDLAFKGLLPGTPQSVSVNFSNNGNAPESLWVAFPNSTALSALNSLGRYGAVHLNSGGAGSVGDVFDSSNLNDSVSSCGGFSASGCWPLQRQYLIATNLSPHQNGTFSFTFEFASAYSAQSTTAAGARWNPYPVSGQAVVKSSDGVGAGLPYEIIAVQPGFTPGQLPSIEQREPFGDTVITTRSGPEFRDHLKVAEPKGPITFTVTNPNGHLSVSPDGTVTTVGGPLLVGSYVVTGVDAGNNGTVGTWTYTLKVVRAPARDHEGH